MDPKDIKDADALLVMVVSPETTVFSGKVKALTLTNELGSFDVIPYHETFISLLKERITLFLIDNSKKEIEVDSGVIRVYKNNVDIFLGLDTESTQS